MSMASRSLGCLDDDIAGLLGEEVQRLGNEEAGDLGEGAGVHDPEALGAADVEVGVQDGHGVAVGTDGARAGRVVAPRLVLDVLLDFGRRAGVFGAGPDFCEGAVEWDDAGECLAREGNSFRDGLEVPEAGVSDYFLRGQVASQER